MLRLYRGKTRAAPVKPMVCREFPRASSPFAFSVKLRTSSSGNNELKSGGTGDLLGAAVLNHNDFPPTVEGKLSQP